MQDAGRIDAVQDHVHDRHHVGERLLLLAVEGSFLKRPEVAAGEAGFRLQVIEGLAEEAGRAAGAVVDAFANLRPTPCTMARMSGRGV